MRAYLLTERIQPFKLPNVEKATNSGMIHDMIPNIWSANVYKHNQCSDVTSTTNVVILGSIYSKRQSQRCYISAMTLAILF